MRALSTQKKRFHTFYTARTTDTRKELKQECFQVGQAVKEPSGDTPKAKSLRYCTGIILYQAAKPRCGLSMEVGAEHCLAAPVGERLAERPCTQVNTCILHTASSSGPSVATTKLVQLSNPRSALESTSKQAQTS